MCDLFATSYSYCRLLQGFFRTPSPAQVLVQDSTKPTDTWNQKYPLNKCNFVLFVFNLIENSDEKKGTDM